MSSDDASNADTEPPDEYDAYIASVKDPEEQAQLRWERYLCRLKNGAWGDYIALQGISDMLGVTVKVLHVNNNSDVTTITVCPSSGTSNYTVNVALMLQFHYVGLDPISNRTTYASVNINDTVSVNDVVANNNNNTNDNANKDNSNNNSANDKLDDEAIAKGDEYNIAITGGPQVCSVLSVENPETDNNIYSIAPAEGQKPISMMLDPGCEEKSNPTKSFPLVMEVFTVREK